MIYVNGALKEGIQYGHSITEQIQKDYSIHFHNVYEIYFFIRGDVDYLVEGKVYQPKPYSLLLLAPHTFHGVRVNSSVPYERYTLHFHPSLVDISKRTLLLSSFPNSRKEHQKEVYFENAVSFHLDKLFELFDYSFQQEDSSIHTLSTTYLESLLATITILSNNIAPTDASSPVSDSILNIIEYLNENLTKTITLDDLCRLFFISKNHLNRSFKKSTGTTVYDYLLHKRIILAKQLIYNGYSSSDAASTVGFKDYSNFYRAFYKIMGHSPTKKD